MFASEVASLDATETLASAARLHAQRQQLDTDLLRLAQHFADLHPDPARCPDDEPVPGGEYGKVYGGPGCPAVAEFAVAEFGAMIGRSAPSAAKLIGQALALRHRLPRTWAAVLNGDATPWKACGIATACLALSEEAAAIVDRKVAGIVDTVTPHRLANIVKAARWEADPDAARAAAEAKAKERGVYVGRTDDDHGTTTLFIRAATGDVIRLDTTIGQIADALAALGDTDTLDQRRATAVGILADPALAHQLLEVAHLLTKTQPHTTHPTGPTDCDHPRESAGHERTHPGGQANSTGPGDPAESARSEESARSGSPAASGRPAGPHGDRDAAEQTPAGDAAGPVDHPEPADGPGPVDGARPVDGVKLPTGRRELAGRLAAIRHTAYSTGIGATGRRPGRTTLYVHITDQTLLANGGTARVEDFGPVFTARLSDLLGHEQVVIQPVIDLNDHISVDAYEIPRRIRERIKLTHPIEQFPFGTRETTARTDLDHIQPYDPLGPPGQTSTTNLAPLRRYSHRVKTHGGWRVRRLDDHTLEWTTRHGFRFRVDHTGTHPITDEPAQR